MVSILFDGKTYQLFHKTLFYEKENEIHDILNYTLLSVVFYIQAGPLKIQPDQNIKYAGRSLVGKKRIRKVKFEKTSK